MSARKDGATTQPVWFNRKHTAIGAAVEIKRAQVGRCETSIHHGQRAATILLQLLQILGWSLRPFPVMLAYRSVGWKCCRLMLLEANDVACVVALADDTDLFPYQQHHLQRRGEWTLCWLPLCWLIHGKLWFQNVTIRNRKQHQVQLDQHLHFSLSQVELLDRTKL